MRKPVFCICENKDADQLISAFVFAIRIVQFLFYLSLKFQASSHLLWLYSLVCVGPGRKPRRPVFSERGSYIWGSALHWRVQFEVLQQLTVLRSGQSYRHYENMSVQYAATSQSGENDNFWLKMFDIFLIFAQNIDCWYTLEPPQRGGSNKYPQSMFCSENTKNTYTPVNSSFTI